MIRKIVQIDQEKCDGCGLCVSSCKEGAIEIVDGKARLSSDIYCDGLGACLGHCPQDAITIIEREAEEFDEIAATQHITAENSAAEVPKVCQCPSSQAKKLTPKCACESDNKNGSRLANWPIQITLVPPGAPYFADADLLIAADCIPFAYADFHKLLQGKILLIGCPKLDDANSYIEKLSAMFKQNDIKSITIAHMEVPCCFGLEALVKKALDSSGKNIEVKAKVFGISG